LTSLKSGFLAENAPDLLTAFNAGIGEDITTVDELIKSLSGKDVRKAYAEYMMEGISAQLKDFIGKQDIKNVGDMAKALVQFGEANPGALKAYGDAVTSLADIIKAIDYDKEAKKLTESIALHGKVGKAAVEAQYKAMGFNEMQIKALIDLAVTEEEYTSKSSLSQSILQQSLADTTGAYELLTIEMYGHTDAVEGELLAVQKLATAMQILSSIKYENPMANVGGAKLTDLTTAFGTKYGGMSQEYQGKFTEAQYQSYLQDSASDFWAQFASLDHATKQYLENYSAEFTTLLAVMRIALGKTDYLGAMQEGTTEVRTNEKENLKVSIADWWKSEQRIWYEDLVSDFEGGLISEDLFKDLTNLKVAEVLFENLKTIGDSLINTTLNELVTSLYSVGEALYSDADASDVFTDSIQNIAMAIMDALPELLLQAGVMMLPPPTTALGLALIALSGLVSVASGYLNAASDGSSNTSNYPSSTISYNAKGNAFSNGMLSSSTLLASRSGWQVGGELGTEAILPLSRNSNGDLGVIASTAGSGTSVNVPINIEVVNQTGTAVQAETTESTGADGSRQIKMIIKQAVGEQMAKGEYDKVLSSRYGVKSKGVA